MKRRYFYLGLLLIIVYFSSLLSQSFSSQPTAARLAAQEFKSLNVGFCVSNPVGDNWAISITNGSLPKGAVGLLSVSKTELVPGDCLSALVQLSPIEGFSRFVFRATLREVFGEIRHQTSLSAINAMRKFASSFNGDSANLVSGLAVGIDRGLSREFLSDMRLTGLTHLTAVSGANCAIVLGVFWLFGRAIKLGKNLRFVISVIALSSYVALVGPQPSVLRAAFMMTVVLAAFEFGRRVWVPAALGLGSSCLLVADPWLVSDYGFWLSVLATFGLVLLTPFLNLKFQEFLPKPFALGLSATVAAQLWCIPILVQLQGGFTTYSVLSNILVEPMVPVVTVLGLLATILGPIFPMLGELLMQLASIPSSWIVYVANSLAQAPFGLVEAPTGIFGIGLLIVLVLASSFAITKRNVLAGFIAGLAVLIWSSVSFATEVSKLSWPTPNWQVVACDVGQGDALVIRSAAQVSVIDLGRDPELIDRCLDRLNVRNINLLVITHFDNDHVGGWPGLLRGRTVKLALVSKFIDERPEAKSLIGEIQSSAEQFIAADKNLSGVLGDFHWRVISSLGTEASSANQGSLGMSFEDENFLIYTLADLDEVAQIRAIDEAVSSNKATVVKVSHHGSSDQAQEFYERIDADLALISVGRGNPYGHPTKKVLKLLEVVGSEVLRTDAEGSIAIAINNGVIEASVSGAR